MIDRRRNPPQERQDRRCKNRRVTKRTESSSETGIRIMRSGKDTQVLQAELVDASKIGLRVLSSEDVRESETLLVEVRAPNRCFNLAGTVVWSTPTEDGRFRLGCDLIKDVSAEDFAVIRALLEATSPE